MFTPLDIDECQNSQSHNCEQICINLPGTFLCDCRDGYNLNADAHSCDGEMFALKDLVMLIKNIVATVDQLLNLIS